jgi:hypothetical protein
VVEDKDNGAITITIGIGIIETIIEITIIVIVIIIQIQEITTIHEIPEIRIRTRIQTLLEVRPVLN